MIALDVTPSGSTPPGPQPGGDRLILAAEDDRDDAYLLRRAFADAQSNVRLALVEDGPGLLTALDRGQPRRPDLILLDLDMPRTKGCEVLRRIKADERFRAIPVLVLTTSNARQDVEDCYRAGASAYFVKPSRIGRLVELVHCIERYWFDLARLPAGEAGETP